MKKLSKRKSKTKLHPVMTYILLIGGTILLSGILGLLGLSTNYNIINAIRGNFESTTEAVHSMLNLSGLKLIFRTTVSNFSSFAPLSMLIIILIGIGVMDKSGFLRSFFAVISSKLNKLKMTYLISLILILSSIAGDIMFIVMIPLTALFFMYSKRNPKAGVIMAFAGLTIGTGINIFMNSIDASILNYTSLAALSIDSAYQISVFCYIVIMLFLTFVMAYILSAVTEKVIVPKLGKYTKDIEILEEEFYLDKKKKRGLLFSFVVGTIYLLIFIYNIIPGLPFSGNLLDYSQTLYIDKLFGYNSFFNQGFVFVITLFFFLIGLAYGIGAKTIKNNQDLVECLGHSLDGIGKTLVLIFFASALIAIFKTTKIGNVLVALISNLMGNISFSGIPLILTTFVLSMVAALVVPSPVTSWSILSGVMVPIYMKAGMSPEFAALVFRLGSSITYGLTPFMAYFVIYLAFLNMYSDKDEKLSLFESFKYVLPYSAWTALIFIIVLIIFYIIGIPLGIGSVATI